MFNPNQISINVVGKDEYKELQSIGRATFAQTFVNDCASSDMQSYLEEQHSEKQIRSELENPESKFYFARFEDKVIAYLKINWGSAQTESKLEQAWEIERLYVLAEYQGMKIGRIFMDMAIEQAQSEKYKVVWLGVWENNIKAIRFYENYGFEVFDSHIFTIGTDHQTDLLMKLALK